MQELQTYSDFLFLMLKCQIAVTLFEVKALIKGQISLGEEILYSEPPLGAPMKSLKAGLP